MVNDIEILLDSLGISDFDKEQSPVQNTSDTDSNGSEEVQQTESNIDQEGNIVTDNSELLPQPITTIESEESIHAVEFSEDDIQDILAGNSDGTQIVTDEPSSEEPVEQPISIATAPREPQEDTIDNHEVTAQPLIPENSPTFAINDSTARFSGTEWFTEIKKKRVVLAGLGGIGSWLALIVVRCGISKIVLYDDDTVETVNMAGQLYGVNDVGALKAQVVYKTLRDYSPFVLIDALPSKYKHDSIAWDIMMCGFDNMAARKTFFYSWKRHVEELPEEKRKNCFYQDGRLSIDTFQILSIQGDDKYNMERYEKEFLFSDSEAEEAVCSMKQTTYMASMIASMMGNIFVNWVAQGNDPIVPYKIPFFVQYEAQHMLFKMEE